jgi:release factor glutamine methyltransferase
VAEVLERSRLPPLEAGVLLAHALGVERAWLVAHSENLLGEGERRDVEALYRRRREGEPVAYLTAKKEFYGLALSVSPAVLIPRPETELLVDVALEHLSTGQSVLDLGTGSGAIAIALAHVRRGIRVAACDRAEAALALARANAERHRVSVRFVRSDWFAGFAGERFDVIVSNPPYVASNDPHLRQGDLRYEPRGALQAGPTGLECIERIAAEAPQFLAPGGWLILEHGHDQGTDCVALLQRLGYQHVADSVDLAGVPRLVAAMARGR